MKWYLKVVRDNYANFNGRASRQEYWMFFLFNIIFAFVAGFVDAFLGLGFLYLLYVLAVFIPGLAVAVRRLHDVGKSGWWYLIALVPFISFKRSLQNKSLPDPAIPLSPIIILNVI
jgi:uncharacterized membrane protein YhaH (DUF805 family)